MLWINSYRHKIPPVILFSDDFNRADSATLGSDWTPDTSLWVIASNTAQFQGGSASPQLEQVTTSMGGPDHWVQGTVLPPTTANPFVTAVFARFNTSTGEHYAAWKNGNAAQGSRIVVSKGTAADSYTTIAAGADSSADAAGAAATLRLEVEGTTLRVHHFYSAAWHLVINTTDSSYSTGNFVGISGWRTTGSCLVDDFFAGTGYL